MKKLHLHVKPTFFKWMLSYIGILLLPLLFGSFIYSYSMRTVKDQIDHSQYQTLSQISISFEDTLSFCNHLATTLANSGEVQSLSFFQDGNSYSNTQLVKLHPLLSDLVFYTAANESISDLVIYFPQTGYVMSQGRFCPADWTTYGEMQDYGMPVSDFEKYSVFSENGIHGLNAERKPLLYTYTTATFDQSTSALIMIYLDSSFIHDMISLSGSEVYLAFDDSSFYATGEEQFQQDWSGMIDEEQEYILSETSDEYVMSLYSPTYRVSYINVVQKQDYLSQLYQLRYILISYVVICLIGGVLGSWYLTRHNYRPVDSLLQLVRKADPKASETLTQGNEFTLIHASYQNLLTEYEDNTQKLKQSQISDKNNWMNEMLKGRTVSLREWRGKPVPWLEELTWNTFALLSMDIKTYGILMEENEDEINSQTLDIAYFVIQNISRDLFHDNYGIVVAETDGRLYALLNIHDDFDKNITMDKVGTLCQSLNQLLQEYYQMSLYIDISDIHQGREGIYQCYQDIEEIQEFRQFQDMTDQDILCRGEFEYFDIENEISYSRQCKQLYHYLLNKKMVPAEQMLKDLKRQQQEMEQRKKEYASLEATRLKETDASEEDQTDAPMKEKEVYLVIDQIVSYITLHFTDNMLSVSLLADQFHIKISYLSRSFKERMGIGLLDYINQLRLQRAKELIAQGIAIKDVSELVGYTTPKSLIRIFRQAEGITPSEYRASLSEALEH